MMNAETQQRVQTKEKETSLLILLLVSFGIFGVMFGIWQTLLADLGRDLHLSSGSLGIAISVGLAESLPVMFVGGQIADRRGNQHIRGYALSACYCSGVYSLATNFTGVLCCKRYI